MTELVVAINRQELTKQGVGTDGVYPLDFHALDGREYALLPRSFADNKSPQAVALGEAFPQILGYFQIINPEGMYLAYQRKGKEKGLVGKWSIGVGGHVSHEDFVDMAKASPTGYPDLKDIIYSGACRELAEELSLEARKQLVNPAIYTRVISSYADVVSSVHVGLPLSIELSDYSFSKLTLDPSEFLNIRWMCQDELIQAHQSGDLLFETWSKILIESWVF